MQDSKKQIAEDQHFVPRSYLKLFSNEKNMLSVLDLKNRRTSIRPYSSVCYDKFFYGIETGKADEVSQVVEEYLKYIENKTPRILNDFNVKILNNEHISDGLRYNIACIMSVMWIRSPYLRKQINKMTEEATKWTLGFDAGNKELYFNKTKKLARENNIDVTDEEIEEHRKLVLDQKYKIKSTNYHHLVLFDKVENFANMIYAKNWRVHIADGSYKFFTSDTPVIEWFPERKGLYGASFLDRKHYFATLPTILIETIYPISGKNLIRKRVNDSKVLMLNAVRVENSLNYCYGTDDKQYRILLNLAEQNNPIKMAMKRIYNVIKN